VLSGSVVGRGPDHEPLVIETAPVAWLGERLVDAAREIYEARFDVVGPWAALHRRTRLLSPVVVSRSFLPLMI
jgi:hypothetical protein